MRQSFLALKPLFAGTHSVYDVRFIEPIWRVTKGLDAGEIGVES